MSTISCAITREKMRTGLGVVLVTWRRTASGRLIEKVWQVYVAPRFNYTLRIMRCGVLSVYQ